MTVKDFLEQLNPNSHVFELSVEYRYTESQLLLFAKLYHEAELKKIRLDAVSNRRELLIAYELRACQFPLMKKYSNEAERRVDEYLSNL